jgi:hypothetical protein
LVLLLLKSLEDYLDNDQQQQVRLAHLRHPLLMHLASPNNNKPQYSAVALRPLALANLLVG